MVDSIEAFSSGRYFAIAALSCTGFSGADKDAEGVLNGAAHPVNAHGADLENLLQRGFIIAAVPFQIENDHVNPVTFYIIMYYFSMVEHWMQCVIIRL